MKWETALRIGGIAGVISLGFVAAEALDKLPIGPSKK